MNLKKPLQTLIYIYTATIWKYNMSKEKEIEMLKEKLDYYTLVAADDEFDAGKVIKIVKRLEELEPTEAPKKSVDEFLDDFWKYCEEREREEKILEEFRKQK